MLGRDDKMQPGYVDFPNFAQGLVLLVERLFLRPGNFRKPTMWDFARAVTHGWSYRSAEYLCLNRNCHSLIQYFFIKDIKYFRCL